MKNRGVILIFLGLLVLSLMAISIHVAQVSAQDETPGLPGAGGDDELTGTVGKGTQVAEEYQESENKSDYLQRQWGKVLSNNTYIGPVIKIANKASPVAKPLFKYTVGMEPSLSWLFIITVVLFIVFFVYAHAGLDFSPWSKNTKLVMALGFSIFLGVVGFFKIFAQKLLDLASLFTIWWVQLISGVVIVVLLFVSSMFSKNITKIAKQMKEKKEKEKEQQKVEELGQKVQTQEIVTKVMTEPIKSAGAGI